MAANILTTGQLPTRVQSYMREGSLLAYELTRARDSRALPEHVPNVRRRRMATMLSLCDRSDIGSGRQSLLEIQAMVRDGISPTARHQDSKTLRAPATLHRVVAAEEALYKAVAPKRSERDALVGTVTGKQVTGMVPEVVQHLGSTILSVVAPPTVSPEFGAISMLVPGVDSSGKPRVGTSLTAEQSRIEISMNEATRQIAYAMIETGTDPLKLAQAGRSQINYSGIVDMKARSELREALKRSIILGETSLNWLSSLVGYATPIDKTAVKVDGAIATLVASILNQVGQFNAGVGEEYEANYCVVSQLIRAALDQTYDGNGRSGWEYLNATRPEIAWHSLKELDALVLSPLASGDSEIIIGHRTPAQEANAPAVGMQSFMDESPTIFTFDHGLESVTLYIQGYAGTYQPANDLTRVVRYDTVT